MIFLLLIIFFFFFLIRIRINTKRGAKTFKKSTTNPNMKLDFNNPFFLDFINARINVRYKCDKNVFLDVINAQENKWNNCTASQAREKEDKNCKYNFFFVLPIQSMRAECLYVGDVRRLEKCGLRMVVCLVGWPKSWWWYRERPVVD